MKARLLVLVIVLVLSASLHAATITVVGTLADHDGDGSNANEMADLNRSISLWEGLILSNRIFTLSVVSAAMGFAAAGGISTFNANNIPTSGTITMSTNTTWLVGTSQNQFTQHFDSNQHHQHLVGGPTGGIDFLSVLNQEIGHALGWNAEPVGFPNFNPRFIALMNPQPTNFSVGTTVFLSWGDYNVPLAGDGLGADVGVRVNEMSHTGNTGATTGWLPTNMSRFLPGIGSGDRYLPGQADFEMFKHAYGDTVAGPSDPVPEPATLTLLGIGLLVGAAFRKRFR